MRPAMSWDQLYRIQDEAIERKLLSVTLMKTGWDYPVKILFNRAGVDKYIPGMPEMTSGEEKR